MEVQDRSQVKRLAELLTKLDREFREDFKRSNGIPSNLTLAQYQVLSIIADKGVQCQKDIALDLGVTGPTVVRIIDALEEKELVRRTRQDKDRRIVHVSLTDKGVTTQQECSTLHERRLSTMIERLPSPAADALLTNLSTLLQTSS